MNTNDIKKVLLEELKCIAPEMEEEEFESDEDIRDQVDLDSMDYLKFITQAGTRLNKEIPEKDYSKLETLDDFVKYFSRD